MNTSLNKNGWCYNIQISESDAEYYDDDFMFRIDAVIKGLEECFTVLEKELKR